VGGILKQQMSFEAGLKKVLLLVELTIPVAHSGHNHRPLLTSFSLTIDHPCYEPVLDEVPHTSKSARTRKD
jgi:hypothetical protein